MPLPTGARICRSSIWPPSCGGARAARPLYVDHFSVGVNTVTTYRPRICHKLLLKGNAELTRYALEQGLLLYSTQHVLAVAPR